MSKPKMKKPRTRVSEMDHTNVLRKLHPAPANTLKHSLNPKDPTIQFYHTSTMFYPEGHPMRIYRDAKKAARRR